MSQDWRTQIDASDFLGQQKKKIEIDQRRPSIRKASDLVGPGINATATRITDYNDLLATFNGYYSSDVGAANAPNATEAFVGSVVSDAVLGGRQVFTGLTSGTEYVRTFTRSPTDPESLGWGLWSGQRIAPSVAGYNEVSTVVPNNSATLLLPPTLHGIGASSIYEPSAAGIRVRQQGIYTGTIQVGCSGSGPVQVQIQRPDGDTTASVLSSPAELLAPTAHYPFTAWATDGNQGFSVLVYHSMGVDVTCFWRFTCTRLGDAV